MNNIGNYRPWSAQAGMGNDITQAFERLFDAGVSGNLFRGNEGDESNVVTSQWMPRVDVKEEAGRFVLYADLPGIDPSEIEVQMDKGILTIRGERKSETQTETERFSRIERRYGSFHRRFALPDSADAEGIQAHGRNGVLEISIPKRPETTPRRIQVGNAENGQGDGRQTKQ